MANKYPHINIRSKNELAKQISGRDLPYNDALILINDVIVHFDKYWYDSKMSESEKNKYVRSAIKNNLGTLLKLINEQVLVPHDNLIPNFIFGGISKKSHIQAAAHLLGRRRKRSLLKTDLSTFYEQVKQDKVRSLFLYKFGCSPKAAILLSKLCCVPLGPKGTQETPSVLARGFSTSPRLAVWCNLETFTRLNFKIRHLLVNSDPRIAIYVDDIGISASNVSTEKLESVSLQVRKILKKGGLMINEKKTLRPVMFSEGAEYAGARLGRNQLSPGKKTQKKFAMLKNRLKKSKNRDKKLKNSLKGLRIYQADLRKKN